MTVNETWVPYYEPENKAPSQWVGPGSPRPKKFKTQPSAGKVMATVFWDAKGVILLDFLPKRNTITGVYYANLLDQLRAAISEKHRGKLSKDVLLQQESPHLQSCNRCCRAKRVWINTISCLFAWPSSWRLLPIPKLEKGYPWTSFPDWWRSRDGSWGVGQWKGPWLFQFWADGTWTPLV